MVDLEPKSLEVIQRGATAALLLEAQRELVAAQVEMVLRKVDHAVTNSMLDANLAVGLCHEIAAFRRILDAQKQAVEQGRRAQVRLAEGE